MNKLLKEIFAVGTWNGFNFTLNDLRKMTNAFNSLKDVLNVPLKLGHNDEQPVLDGQPALGWVDSMSVDEAQTPPKLVAEFINVPDVMMTAFDKKLYRDVSIELDFDVQHKGNFYDFVITAIAILGADIPAVNVLDDLGALMSKNSRMSSATFSSVGDHLCFSMNPQLSGDNYMPLTAEEEAKLRKDLAEATALVSSTKTQFSTLESQVKDLTTKVSDAEAATAKAVGQSVVDAARVKFIALLEGAVKNKTITVLQRESFSKVLGIDDDERVVKLVEADVLALLPTQPKDGKFSKQTGEEDDDDLDTGKDAGSELSQKAYAIMEKNSQIDFGRALTITMSANPELSEEYKVSNGEYA